MEIYFSSRLWVMISVLDAAQYLCLFNYCMSGFCIRNKDQNLFYTETNGAHKKWWSTEMVLEWKVNTPGISDGRMEWNVL